MDEEHIQEVNHIKETLYTLDGVDMHVIFEETKRNTNETRLDLKCLLFE